jgi:RNA polymerase sigma-70 factor (ECF subfamily)
MQDIHTQPERALIDADRTRSIHSAILTLPPHYRAVIELRHYQELSYAEIGDTLQIPISDVKSHLYRARKALASLLREDERSA